MLSQEWSKSIFRKHFTFSWWIQDSRVEAEFMQMQWEVTYFSRPPCPVQIWNVRPVLCFHHTVCRRSGDSRVTDLTCVTSWQHAAVLPASKIQIDKMRSRACGWRRLSSSRFVVRINLVGAESNAVKWTSWDPVTNPELASGLVPCRTPHPLLPL